MNKRQDKINLQKSILVVIPDGVGLRNFVYSSFISRAKNIGIDLIFINLTPADLSEFGVEEIKPSTIKINPIADLFKASLIKARLIFFSKVFKDDIYLKYIFPSDISNLKNILRGLIINFLSYLSANSIGISWLEQNMQRWIRQGSTYQGFVQILKNIKPDFVFCTNQRAIKALPAILAAKELQIKTGVFIFSWDNLPKATMVLRSDFYFVWSQTMNLELLKYYKGIDDRNIFITGSPQFEPHLNPTLIKERAVFFGEHKLDEQRRYICYSGDDITTSPFDQEYLRDLAVAVAELNAEGYNLGILFRPSPVDRSSRYDEVLKQFNRIIVKVSPKWDQLGESWDTVVPNIADHTLLVNTIYHTFLVVNIASSMVFDFELFNKPCIYLNYTLTGRENQSWKVQNIYKFVHFRSMPNDSCVYWANAQEELKIVVKEALSDSTLGVLKNTRLWRERIIGNSPENASARLLQSILQVMQA